MRAFTILFDNGTSYIFFLAFMVKTSSTAFSKQGFNTFSLIVCGFFDFTINCEILNDADSTFSFNLNL